MSTTHVVLVPGFWLGAWAWAAVLPALEDAGLVPHPVTLPGLDPAEPHRADVIGEDHVLALLGLVESLDGEVVLVAHSGGAWPVHSVVDRLPERIAHVVYVDTGPMQEGVAPGQAPAGAAGVPFPTDAELAAEELSTEGLDDATLAELRARAVPEPAGVVTAPMRLHDERRLDVPATVICTSLPADALQQLLAAGELPSELPRLRSVRYVDLPTGHWPMFSRPVELGRLIADAATGR